jgi:hypothetical protein
MSLQCPQSPGRIREKVLRESLGFLGIPRESLRMCGPV